MIWFISLFLMIGLTADVTLDPNPVQWFNSTANTANRIVYFFLNKASDGSVFLQVEPPPFYPSDQKYIDGGVAYISAAKVLQTYTAEEVAELKDVDITFTVMAHTNPNLNQGYQFFGQVYQWGINLDPRSIHFNRQQSVNITQTFGIIQNLQEFRFNEDNNQLTIYSDMLDYNTWLGFTDGAFLSPNLIYNYLFEKTEAGEDEVVDFTIRVDFDQIANLAVGTYSLYFQFQMNALALDQSFDTTLQEISDAQVIQVGYLYNSIIGVNAYLDGNNALYDPIVADQVILTENKETLIKKYNDTLDAMTVQWTDYSNMSGLSSASITLINSMLNYIATAEADRVNFSV